MTMDIKEIDTLTALASGIKQQSEETIYILSHPENIESIDDFVIILRKVAMDFLQDEGSRDLVSQIALMLENSPKLKPSDLIKWKRIWNYIINQIIVQLEYKMSERVGLKFALLSFMKGPRVTAEAISLKEYAGMK